jgi:hypothetical protein
VVRGGHCDRPVAGTVASTSGGISSAVTGFDDPPRSVTLRPGERARSGLVWRNTVQPGIPVDVPYVRVRTKSGAAPVTVTPHFDLGTTGKLGVSPWRTEEQRYRFRPPSAPCRPGAPEGPATP